MAPVTGDKAERHWRRLYAEFAELLERNRSPLEVATLFYEHGVVETPVVPPNLKSVREYVIDRLHGGTAIPSFLRHGLPKAVLELDIDGADVRAISMQMESLGYTLEEIGKEVGVATYLPPKRLPRLPLTPTRAQRHPARVSVPNLPADVQELVDELNDNLARENRNAAALLIRKIISQTVFVAMAKRNRASDLKTADGDDIGLGIALQRCKQVCGVSSQAMARVTSAKWIGDTANHSYRARVGDDELERTVTGMTLFLREVL